MRARRSSTSTRPRSTSASPTTTRRRCASSSSSTTRPRRCPGSRRAAPRWRPSARGCSPTRRASSSPRDCSPPTCSRRRGPGRHLVTTMLEPMPEALEHLEQLRATGAVDLGSARVTRTGRAGIVELVNVRHLNAEDGATLGPTEVAVDLVAARSRDRGRGDARRRGRPSRATPASAYSAPGINLTHLYHGRIDFLFYLVRDLGYVNKLYRGLADRGRDPSRSCGSRPCSGLRSAAPASCCT